MKTSGLVLALTLVSTSLFYSCGKVSTAEDLKDAQMCLNTAPASQAKSCVSKIASDTSVDAYKLRCAAVFISEGFGNPSSFISALDQINSTGSCTGGCSSTMNAMSSLNFSAGSNLAGDATQRARNLSVSLEAMTECAGSQISIYAQIASIFRLGTIAAMTAQQIGAVTGPGGTISASDLEAALNSGQIAPADLGEVVLSTYSVACTNVTNAADSTKKYCAELDKSLEKGGSSPAAIGTCLQKKLKDPNDPC